MSRFEPDPFPPAKNPREPGMFDQLAREAREQRVLASEVEYAAARLVSSRPPPR